MSEYEILKVLQVVLEDSSIQAFVGRLVFSKRKRIWIAGNGGSASTAIHFASDLMNLGYDVTCMDENISRITAITNDYSWEEVYRRQMESFKLGDVLIVISVHGGITYHGSVWSSNLFSACKYAKEKQGLVMALLGGDGGAIKKEADVSIVVPHEKAWVVEGIHCVLSHLICEMLTK